MVHEILFWFFYKFCPYLFFFLFIVVVVVLLFLLFIIMFCPYCDMFKLRFFPLIILASPYKTCSWIIRLPTSSSRGMTSRSLNVLKSVSWTLHRGGRVLNTLLLISYWLMVVPRDHKLLRIVCVLAFMGWMVSLSSMVNISYWCPSRVSLFFGPALILRMKTLRSPASLSHYSYHGL